MEKPRTKRGEPRIEKYEGKDEPFGLNKRTRRLKKTLTSKRTKENYGN